MSDGIRGLLGQTALYGLSSVLARVLNYLLVPLYTRLLAPDLYGVVALFYAYIAILAVVTSLGMETTYFRFGKHKEAYGTAFHLILAVALPLCTTLLLFPSFFAELIGRPELGHLVQLSAGIILLDALCVIPMARLRKRKKALQFALLRLSSIGLNLGLNIFFFLGVKWISVDAIFWANLAGSFLLFFILFVLVGGLKNMFQVSSRLARKMFRYSWPVALASLAYVLNEAVDRILLGSMLPETTADFELGVYSACYKLSILMTLCVQAYRLGVEPYFFQSDERKQENLARLMHAFCWIGGLLFIGLSTQLFWLKHFIGEEYHSGIEIVPILLLANGMLGVYFNLSVWYKTTDKTYLGALFSILGVIITLYLNVAFIPEYAYWASAWATLACYFSMVLASGLWGWMRRKLDYNWYKVFGYWLVPVLFYLLFSYAAPEGWASLYFSVPMILLIAGVGLKLEMKKKRVVYK